MFKPDKNSPPPVTDENTARRLDWVDMARGVGILLVVLGHACGGIVDASLGKGEQIPHILYLAIYSFHMPLFFCLSGLFVTARLKANPNGFLTGSAVRIGRAYITWSVIQFTAIYLIGGAANHPIEGQYLPQLVSLLWRPVSQFWFLYVLVFLQLFAFILVPRLGAKGFALIGIGVTMCSHLYYALFVNGPLPAPIFSQFCTYFVWFGLGVLAGPYLPKLSEWKIKPWHVAVAVLVWAAMFGLAFYALEVQPSHYPTVFDMPSDRLYRGANGPPFAPAQLSGTIMVILICCAGLVPFPGIVSYLGRHSMAIFLTHILFIAGTRIVALKLMPSIEPLVLMMVVAIAGLAGSVALLEVARRLKIARALSLV